MAKTVGLDAGEYEIKLVELEGSYRRTRLSRIAIERVEQDDAGADDALHASREAESALRALKEANASRENVTLGFPSREAVFRNLTVPFSGRDQIRKVIKFEVEGSIHSHSVDDMVVDFHTVGETGGESQVMVAAVPKSSLQVTLLAMERLGIEPEVVDLDAMALYRVADWCGAFSEEVGDGEEPAGEAGTKQSAMVPAGGGAEDPVRVVLDIGARSTQVLLVVKGQLVDMRTLRSGEASLIEELSRSGGVSTSEARVALGYQVTEADDYVVQDDKEEDSPDLEGTRLEDREVAAVESREVPEHLVGQARDHFLSRLRRELIRFLTSVKQMGPIEAVWVTGGGCSLPGMDDLLSEVFGCAPGRLRVLDQLNHNLDEDEARELEPRIAVALGLALGKLGGPPGFNFRQEELAFTRGFDRVKFPLAIACMVALFLVVVYAVKSWRDVQSLELKYGQTYVGEQDEGARPRLLEFQGFTGSVLNASYNSWFSQIKNFGTAEYRALLSAVEANPVFGIPPQPSRLDVVLSRLRRYLDDQREATGVFSDLTLESGFAVLVRWAEVLMRIDEELGRFLVMDMELNLPFNPNSRWLKFTIALRGADFRTKHAALVRALEDECQRPDSPFLELEDQGREILFEGGSYYILQVDIRPTYEAFVPATGGE